MCYSVCYAYCYDKRNGGIYAANIRKILNTYISIYQPVAEMLPVFYLLKLYLYINKNDNDKIKRINK